MRDLYTTRQSLESRLQSEGFKFRVNQIISAWDDWAVYPKDFLTKLNKSFNGIEVKVCIQVFFAFDNITSVIVIYIEYFRTTKLMVMKMRMGTLMEMILMVMEKKAVHWTELLY